MRIWFLALAAAAVGRAISQLDVEPAKQVRGDAQAGRARPIGMVGIEEQAVPIEKDLIRCNRFEDRFLQLAGIRRVDDWPRP